jgi:hypothetical protein
VEGAARPKTSRKRRYTAAEEAAIQAAPEEAVAVEQSVADSSGSDNAPSGSGSDESWIERFVERFRPTSVSVIAQFDIHAGTFRREFFATLGDDGLSGLVQQGSVPYQESQH